jgi:UDPglucose--hexose-1-phosphate uridylyltransferase
MSKKAEIRKDLLSDEWIIVSPERGERPNNFEHNPVCPFCDLKNQEQPKLYFYKGKEDKNKEWTTIVIPNKYPVIRPTNSCKKYIVNNLYTKINPAGFHDIIITKEHDKFLSDLPLDRVEEFFSCIQALIIDYKKYSFAKQIAIFHNKGEKAGASQQHPHYQAMTLPIIEKEFKRELSNFYNFHKKNNECLHCKINKTELKDKQRIIFENDDFIAFCPFAPKILFQVIISPKRHFSNFEEITEKEKKSLAIVFKKILHKYDKGFENLAYNFFLHSAPLDKKYPYFHCYWSFSPRICYFGGLEMGFGLEISSILPEEQAEFLRKIK